MLTFPMNWIWTGIGTHSKNHWLQLSVRSMAEVQQLSLLQSMIASPAIGRRLSILAVWQPVLFGGLVQVVGTPTP